MLDGDSQSPSLSRVGPNDRTAKGKEKGDGAKGDERDDLKEIRERRRGRGLPNERENASAVLLKLNPLFRDCRKSTIPE